MASLGFGDRLAAAIEAKGPLCVGVDPHPSLLQAWGLPDAPASLQVFADTVLEGATDVAAAFKPQVAFFERHGAAGLAVLEKFQRDAADAGVLVLADAKRGDIGSTMAAYADAWLGESSPLKADAVTVSPYLGFESLRPALDLANQTGRGTFVLALTSNPEGKSVQHVGGRDSVAKSIIEAARTENEARSWQAMGPTGLVIGATVGGDALRALEIDLSAFNGPILAPGYGAQGATVADLHRVFAGIESQVLVNSSREVLSAGPHVGNVRNTAKRVRDQLVTTL